MTGSSQTSYGLDQRRRRALFRSWHRGTREMDLIMGQFADKTIAAMSEQDLADFEALMEVPDQDVYVWISGQGPVPTNYDTDILRAISNFHVNRGDQTND